MTTRTDKQGYSTKVTALGRGFGCRVLKDNKVVSEGWAQTKMDIAPILREMLRMIDKCGNPSDMASASRERNYIWKGPWATSTCL
jgi:hypothetical protein